MDERRPPRLLWWAVQLGFLTVFGVAALGYGLWFGTQLVATQRQGLEAIAKIEIFEQEQVYQMRQMSERLDRIELKLAAGAPP